jgi:archaellum component FlaC
MASAEDSQRASGSSAGRSSGSSRRQNVGASQRGGGLIDQAGGLTNAPQPQQQLSTIEKSVTHLLVATKQLLETLTLWSRGSAAESEVSDVYVRLGYEFNIACRAFNAIGVDTTDLGPVPDLLRAILEDTLSQEANQASLDKYLPRIRDIIINLLHGLKKKQQRLRQRNGKDGADARPPRQSSTASNASLESNLTQQLEDVPSRASSHRSFAQRQGSNEFGGPDLPPRTTSTQGRTSPRRQNLSPPTSMHQQQLSSRDTSDSTLSSNTMQNIPVIAPYPENDTMPTNQGFESREQREQSSPEPPPPPPKQNDALQALQRGGELERRASRRFSAYQIQKHLGTSVNGIGTIPPAQNSPIPNRGRDVRESMNAVRSRRSVLQHNRTKSRNDREGHEPSPSRLQHEVRRISETSETDPPQPPFAGKGEPGSPVVKTPEDKLGTAYPFPDLTKDQREGLGATVNGPVEDHFGPPGEMTPQELSTQPATPVAERKSIVRRTSSRLSHPPQRTPPQSQFIGESSPQPGKELTLFLQYKSKIKKFVLSDGADLTVPRLQLAFIEKFAWNTHNNGVDLPEIYIQDPVSGVRHEVEDLSDIKERSVLVLNVEQLDEVKRHIDDGIGGLRRMIEGVKTSVEDQQATIQRVWDRQQETAKEIANIAAAPAAAAVSKTPSTTSSTTPSRTVSIKDKTGQLDEVQSLRRDLAVVRQTYTTFVDDIKANMATIRTKAASIGPAAAKAAVPELDPNSGRAYVNGGKKTLSDDSEKIVNRVDDLQDTVEDLRKDVVTRGVRPIPRQLEDVSKDISTATADLRKLKEFLKREKPVWTKIWEKELQVVCDDRDLLTMQEELAADLEDDLEKAAATFALVEEATKQQNLANPRATDDPAKTVRSSSRTLRPFAEDQNADPQKAKDGVLGEVRALQPNHESRLEAIERAERARQRELESRRGGEFQKELGNFVEEGKLKKSGGVEEVERLRLVKEERARKENYERVAQRERDRAEREVAAAAAALAPPAEAETQAEGEAEAAADDVVPEEASGDGPEAPAEDPVAAVDSSADPAPVDAKTDAGADGVPNGESGPPAAA